MSCVFEKELEWTRWNPTGRCRKEEKKEKEIVSWMEIFPTFIVRCYRQSSRANPVEDYFIFLSVCGDIIIIIILILFFLFSWFTKMGSGDALILYCLILTCAIPPPPYSCRGSALIENNRLATTTTTATTQKRFVRFRVFSFYYYDYKVDQICFYIFYFGCRDWEWLDLVTCRILFVSGGRLLFSLSLSVCVWQLLLLTADSIDTICIMYT